MDEPILGQIQLFAFSWKIEGWMPCESQLLRITENQALFALIGTTYGGDGQATFALPDLRNKAPHTAMHYHIAVRGLFPQRQ